MFAKDHALANVDPELWAVIQKENRRQHDHTELNAPQKNAAQAVMQARGSQFTEN